MGKLAFSHPGKLGDALYSLLTIRYLCRRTGTTCDFYTSEFCRPLVRLFKYQSYIDEVFIPPNYKIERTDMGVQPWRMPIDSHYYERVYHLGFRSVPDRPLHEFIAKSVGIDPTLMQEIKYEHPVVDVLPGPYIVLAPRGNTTFKMLFLELIDKSSIPIVQIGARGESIDGGIDITGLDMLETVSWLAGAKAFVGLMSSQLVLANGFNIPKIAVHDGKSWDMRHVINSPTNYYPVNPTVSKILELLEL